MTASVTQFPDHIGQVRDQFATRILDSARGALEMFSIFIGDQLGLYERLGGSNTWSSSELARATGTHERYIREWLEQQTIAGILCVVDPSVPHDERRFYLPPGHDEVLGDSDSLSYLAPLAQLLVGATQPLDKVLDAYRTGAGVPYSDYGKHLVHGQARMNRAAFLQLLPAEWLTAVPGLAARLESDPPARVADLGCGAGFSSIGVAQHYRKVHVDGFDLDGASIDAARVNARQFGIEDRVHFEVRDAADHKFAGKYDLVMALECLHDMSNPVGALAAMRQLAKPEGCVLVVDERVADSFDPKAGGLEWLMYGASIVHCLPVGMAQQPSAATGTVMRASTLENYARAAGFECFEILPIDYPMFNFYRLHQR